MRLFDKHVGYGKGSKWYNKAYWLFFVKEEVDACRQELRNIYANLSIADFQRQFISRITYKRDHTTFPPGITWWQNLITTWRKKTGDCEEFAYFWWMYFINRKPIENSIVTNGIIILFKKWWIFDIPWHYIAFSRLLRPLPHPQRLYIGDLKVCHVKEGLPLAYDMTDMIDRFIKEHYKWATYYRILSSKELPPQTLG